MKELIEKLNSMTEEEAKTYIESLSEEEKKALKEKAIAEKASEGGEK